MLEALGAPAAASAAGRGAAMTARAAAASSGGSYQEGMLRIFRKDLPALDVEASLLDQGLESSLAIDFQQQLKNIGVGLLAVGGSAGRIETAVISCK